MAAVVQYTILAVLVASCFAAPSHSGDVGGYGGYHGFGHHPGGGGFGSYPGSHFGASQSFSKSSASASSSSQSGGGHLHG